MKMPWPSYLPAIALLLTLAACQRDAESATSEPTPSPLASTGVDSAAVDEGAAPTAPPVSRAASEGQLAVLEILSEGGDVRDGMLTVDAYEGDRLWMGVLLDTEAGTPLSGELVSFQAQGTAASPPPQVISQEPRTDGDGYMEFQVIVANAGTYPISVSAAGVRREFQVNVIPNDFDQWLQGIPRDGLLPWNTLMQTRVSLDDEGLMVPEYPPEVKTLDGDTVRLAGFMLPLGMEPAQRHFLLAASPPSCFFHVPGGPATVVEIFADDHPVMGTFDPLVVEGRLELVEQSDIGILYRLKGAKSVNPGVKR